MIIFVNTDLDDGITDASDSNFNRNKIDYLNCIAEQFVDFVLTSI